MSENADPVDTPPEAPAWRRRVARTIDVVAALTVFSLFLTPVIAVQGHHGPASALLKVSAWVYVAIFIVLGIPWLVGKRHRGPWRPYVTVGMSIMDLYPLRVGKTTRMVRSHDFPQVEQEKRGRAAAAIVLPLIVVGVVFVVLELIAYA